MSSEPKRDILMCYSNCGNSRYVGFSLKYIALLRSSSNISLGSITSRFVSNDLWNSVKIFEFQENVFKAFMVDKDNVGSSDFISKIFLYSEIIWQKELSLCVFFNIKKSQHVTWIQTKIWNVSTFKILLKYYLSRVSVQKHPFPCYLNIFW